MRPASVSVQPPWKTRPLMVTSNVAAGVDLAVVARSSWCQRVPRRARQRPWAPVESEGSRGPIENAENSPMLSEAVR